MRPMLGFFKPKPSLEERITTLEDVVYRLGTLVAEHIKRIDENTKVLNDRTNYICDNIVATTKGYPGSTNN